VAVLFLQSVRLWFALAVAVIASALADPLLEAASNAGVFGHARYTDYSNLDVLPALAVGLVAIAIHVGLRIRIHIDGDGEMMKDRLRSWDLVLRSRAAVLLPATFAAQVIVLYSMETIEQAIIAGHALGGLIWLGAPPVIALAVHALVCVVVFFITAAVMHELAWATLRVVKIIRAILTRGIDGGVAVPRLRVVLRKQLAPELCTAGERAPPSYAR
jgi:hypothetical protein